MSDHAPVLVAPAGPPVVLASASRWRAAMLRSAGITITQEAAHVDESEIKVALRADGATVQDAATTLAEIKAGRVAARHPAECLVVGADQILTIDGEWLEKPHDRDAARAQLASLRDREHELVSAVVLFRSGARIWHHVGRARLRMRPFSDAFLEAYLDRMGDAVTETVGGYQLEGTGAQLFAGVEGDHFTVIGMPLLPLLEALRAQGVLMP